MAEFASPEDADTFARFSEDVVLFNIIVKPSCFHWGCVFINQNISVFLNQVHRPYVYCEASPQPFQVIFHYKDVLFKSQFFSLLI